MNVRRRLVVVTALCVAVPLALSTVVALFAAGALLRHRVDDRLDLVLSAARQSLAARQAGLDAQVAQAGAQIGAGRPAAVVVADLVASGRIDQAELIDAQGRVVVQQGHPAAGGTPALRSRAATAPNPTPNPTPNPAPNPAPNPTPNRAPNPAPDQAAAVRGEIWLTPALLASMVPDRAVTVTVVPTPAASGVQHAITAGDNSQLTATVPLPAGGGLQAAIAHTAVSDDVRQLGLIGLVLTVGLFGVTIVVADRVVARALGPMTRVFRSRSQELLDTREQFRRALQRLGDVLTSTHDLEGIVGAIVETALLAVPADAAVYYRFVGMPGKLRALQAVGFTFEDIALDGTGLAGFAALTEEVTVLPGPAPLDPSEPAATAGIAVPVQSQGRLVGVVAVYGTRLRRAFTDEEVESLQTLVRQTEVAIANIELHAQARREALTDGVTGLWNRRQFDLRCRDAQMASSRFGEPYAVALFDVDNFKRINDTYDHFTGDAALVHLSELLRRAAREVDVVARWGGEEFAILIQRAGMQEATIVAERVRESLHEEPLLYDQRTIWFTVSAGVASHPDSGLDPADVVGAADAALLRAKAAGKDRVEQASPARAVAPATADAELPPG